MTPRQLALKVLNGPNHLLGSGERYTRFFNRYPQFDNRDRAFIVHLVQGVHRWRLRLDWIIKQHVTFAFEEIEPAVLNLIRIALYQVFFMDRVPDSAAVNEAVKQAKTFRRRHVVGFVNGILRNICRNKNHVFFPDRDREPVDHLSVYYAYPYWLVRKWIDEMGYRETEKLLHASNQIPDRVVRANSLKTDRAGLINQLEREGILASATRYSPQGLKLEEMAGSIDRLVSYSEGLFQVQSEAAQLCALLLAPKPGETVLDLCSGLGGKTTHLAEVMEGKGRVFALDNQYQKLVKLNESSSRLESESILPLAADAGRDLSKLFKCRFDRVLIDGPCSALGTLARHPDGKWNKDENTINRLARLQKRILNASIPLIRTGGKILYVTCTISKEENDAVVKDFLKKNKEFAIEDLARHIPKRGLELVDKRGFYRTLPHLHGIDGFFGALFVKKKSS